MTVEANAKVNLSLEVYGRRADGYHELRSIVLPISLADDLSIEVAADGGISSDSGYGEKDLVVRAARALRDACPSVARMGAKVYVDKRIPVGGGLGGGSADAAATLRALNEAWGLGLAPERLAEIGALVGSDVPALVLAQHFRAPVLMEGRGERVRLLDAGEREALSVGGLGGWMVLANPGVESSTVEVYSRCVPRGDAPSGDFDAFAAPVNDLQAAACALHPEIASALAAMMVAGAKGVMMSGSGSTVFGFADGLDDAARVAAAMESVGCRAWLARSTSHMEEGDKWLASASADAPLWYNTRCDADIRIRGR